MLSNCARPLRTFWPASRSARANHLSARHDSTACQATCPSLRTTSNDPARSLAPYKTARAARRLHMLTAAGANSMSIIRARAGPGTCAQQVQEPCDAPKPRRCLYLGSISLSTRPLEPLGVSTCSISASVGAMSITCERAVYLPAFTHGPMKITGTCAS